jgi:LPXTG-motif cell wall-anchored protein
MTRFIGLSVLLVSVAAFAFAGGPTGPEIDASSGVAAIGLLSGGMLVLRARRKK